MAKQANAAGDAPLETARESKVVAVVREWDPHNQDSLTRIHETIDSWGRSSAQVAPKPANAPEHGEIVGKVERLTRNVKARTVTVTETITLDEDGTLGGEPWDAVDAPVVSLARSPPRKAKSSKAGRRRSKAKASVKAKATQAKLAKSSAADAAYRPQCAALTADGAQCRNSARGTSKYCAPHKGYQPPTTKGLAKRIEGDAWDPHDKVTDRSSVKGADTRPVVRKAKDTQVSVRKVAKKGRGKKR